MLWAMLLPRATSHVQHKQERADWMHVCHDFVTTTYSLVLLLTHWAERMDKRGLE